VSSGKTNGSGTNGSFHLMEQLGAYGCTELIHLKGEPTAALVEYLDLLPSRTSAPLLPEAVAEFQGRPVMYVLDADAAEKASNRDAIAVRRLQQLLANRSEQACLGIVRPGSLEVYPVNLDHRQLAKAAPRTILESAPEAPTFFQSLAAGAVPLTGQPKEADFVFREIHALLSAASDELIGMMKPLEVLSVTGRALFFRFLLDRQVIVESELSEICPLARELKDCFSDPEKAAATSCWLDETFNGDLLPLDEDFFSEADPDERRTAYGKMYRRMRAETNGAAFNHLQAILRGWESVGGSTFQRKIDWNDLDFAHIPIGVLSQVYETFSRQWDEEHAEKTSIYYTPRNIARCLVEEALGGLKEPADAHVLDPACGAGMFLVLAFRRLVRARWEKEAQRPDTRAIQGILYNQLRGFDVSESALRLAALALYITAIELNGSPRPPKRLKFPRGLQERVLFNFGSRDGDHRTGFVLGSLGPDVPDRFDSAFDVVIGNPPWTRLRVANEHEKDKNAEKTRVQQLNDEFTAISQRVLRARNLADIAHGYTNPDNNPDLPFIWRAAEWAKPDGLIAMALPARVLFKQSDQGRAARAALMRGLTTTGIINASNLAETAVWPKMKQPFILYFARNAVPSPDHCFYFATVVRERRVNDRGLFRLDSQAAEPVAASAVVEKPWLLKALSVGTSLDAEVTDRITILKWTTIGRFWNQPGFYSGKGFSLEPPKDEEPPEFLLRLPLFEDPEIEFRVRFADLKTFLEQHGRVAPDRPRDERLYQPPLLIVPKSPGEDRSQPKSYRSLKQEICFSSSYYGFSAAGHADAGVLVSLLYLITHSLLFQYFCLMFSSSLGAERRTFLKVDLESFPFPDPGALVNHQKRRILALAEALETSATKPWKKIDDFVFELYGLDDDDATVVKDTLTVGAPYQSVRGPAEQSPDAKDTATFRSYLEDMLQPAFQVAGQSVRVELLPVAAVAGPRDPLWRFAGIVLKGDQLPPIDALLRSLMEEANKAAASRVVMRVPEGGLVLGVLNQRRFWTRSRARLCGLYILRNHLDAFPLGTET
jgi:hypothetical protein